MTDRQTTVQVSETVEIFPNQASEPSTRKVATFLIRPIIVPDTELVRHCSNIGDTAEQHPLTEDKPAVDDVKLEEPQSSISPATTQRLHESIRFQPISDPISSIAFVPIIKSCSKTDLNEQIDTEPPPILQNKIQSRPPSPATGVKCIICEYRNSIEKWRFPDGLVFCPKCYHIEAPLLRTQTRKASSLFSSLRANILMYCWPLCFLPFLTPRPLMSYLHCAQCFTFLGMYDEQKRCIRPNHEYVEYNGCFSAEESERRAKQQEQEKWKENMFQHQIY